jgi:5-methyltetrahydrofolate--homocysteine methyltransferase
MLIVGERINTSRKEIDRAVEERDAAFIRDEARRQVEAGAQVLDVNAGSRVGSELKDLTWLIDVIQDSVSVRLSLDSATPSCLLEAMGRIKQLPMINSTTAERSRFEQMVPVIEEQACEVVALCVDDRGLPGHVHQVLENGEKLVRDLESLGVPRERIYLDPVLRAVSTDSEAGLKALEAIRRIHGSFQGVRTLCGLSNISYALPQRSLLNRTFLALAMEAGLSACLLDPLDTRLMGTWRAATLFMGRDAYCLEYIRAYREGKLPE